MAWIQTGSAVVIVANQFNPSVLSQLWLVRNGVLAEEDLKEGCLFADPVVQVQSRQFNLLVTPPQLQFVPLVPVAAQSQLIRDKVGAIVTRLPHTPFRGLGLNFNWHLIPVDGDTMRLSRELFANPNQPLYGQFHDANARFGAYLSKDFNNFRLKLDIKPIEVQGEGRVEHHLQFAFNFHSNLGEDAAERIDERLGLWDALRNEAQRIIGLVEPWDQQ